MKKRNARRRSLLRSKEVRLMKMMSWAAVALQVSLEMVELIEMQMTWLLCKKAMRRTK